MSYARKNYQTKAALIKDLKELKRLELIVNPSALDRQDIAQLRANLTIYNPSMPNLVVRNGMDCVEGPHFPKPHRWYASVNVKDGVIHGAR